MGHWTRFVEWCREPSKIKIRTFNPKNVMLVELSVLLVSVIASETWLLQVPSISRPHYPISASISGDGTKIAYTLYMSGGSGVFLVNSDGTGLTQLTSDQALNLHASISGDGTKVAFDTWIWGRTSIFVVNSDGTGLTQLASHRLFASYASISDDGTKVAFMSCSHVNGHNEIFVVNSDGTGLTQLTDNPREDSYARISGDGTKVAFQSYDYGDNVDGDNEIFVVNSDGTGLTQLTNNTADDRYVSISGDGAKVAFTSDVAGDNEICVVASDSLNITPTPEAGFSFPLEYAAGIVAVTVAVALVVISLVRKKWV